MHRTAAFVRSPDDVSFFPTFSFLFCEAILISAAGASPAQKERLPEGSPVSVVAVSGQ